MKILRGIGLLLALAWNGLASAAGSCALLAPASGSTLLDFGTYSALNGDVDRTATFTLTCVPDLLAGLAVSYAVSIDAGSGSGGSFTPRRLRAGAHGLDYNLYRDPSRTQIWGDGSAGTSRVTGSCSATCVLSVYGRVFGGQAPPAAAYSDQIVVTLDF